MLLGFASSARVEAVLKVYGNINIGCWCAKFWSTELLCAQYITHRSCALGHAACTVHHAGWVGFLPGTTFSNL